MFISNLFWTLMKLSSFKCHVREIISRLHLLVKNLKFAFKNMNPELEQVLKTTG